MKQNGAIRHFVLAFILALVCYAVFYRAIEHRRIRKGPWVVTFTNAPAGTPARPAPAIVVNQPRLAVTNVQISFAEEPSPPTNALGTLVFNQPQPVPFPIPFGRCVFMDTTFLPGTVTFQFFGHEIQLLPRALTIDHQEHPWVSDSTITLHPVQGAEHSARPSQ